MVINNMISLQFLLIGIGLVWLAAIVTSAEAEAVEPVVTTGYGKVKGKVVDVKGTNRKVHQYLGIPFAKPPVGQLRLSAPQLPEPWANVRDATSHPPVCTQDPAVIKLQNAIFKIQTPPLNMSENCLFVDIYTPAPEEKKKEKLPVMVWMHGGALISGGSTGYDGSAVAAFEEVVIVTLQYRLGILGFFGDSGRQNSLRKPRNTGDVQATGNWGLLDQVQALKWIKNEISKFGGDPGSVTIYGQSAGGLAVTTLMVSPMAKGLFHMAIAESGTFYVNGMVKSDKKDIIQVRDGVPVVSVVVNGPYLPKNPEDLIAAKAVNKVPLMIGNTNDECGFWIPSILQIKPFESGINRRQIDSFVQSYQGLWGSLITDVIQVIPQYVGQTDDPIKIRDSLLKMCGDVLFRKPAAKIAGYLKDSGMPVYVYEFEHQSSVSRDILPSYVKSDHGQELPFIFGHPFLNDDIRIMGNFTTDEEELSKRVMKLWATFARNGNPNSDGLPEWPVWDHRHQSYKINILKNKQTANGNLVQSVLQVIENILKQ